MIDKDLPRGTSTSQPRFVDMRNKKPHLGVLAPKPPEFPTVETVNTVVQRVRVEKANNNYQLRALRWAGKTNH